MAKNDAELQAIDQPKSRSEEYLNFLCGRAVDINALPDPYSRVEHYLEYLCHNGGIGGGGGANPFVGLTNATLNGDIITFNKSDGTTLDVRLTDFIRGELTKVGGDARYEDKIPQLNADGKIHISMIPDLSFNKIHSANNEIEANELINNGTAQIGDTIIVKDTGSVYLYVNDQAVDFGNRTIEIAFANGAVKMVNGEIPNPQGNVTVKAEHIEYDDNQIGLNGTTVQDAIKNLNDKFGDYVHKVNDTTNVGGNIHADKIVKLGADGKLSETMIPDLAITRVVPTDNRTTAEQLVASGQIQVGDVVVLTQDANKVYMYNGNTQGDFENKFIELSLGDGTVKVVNGQRPTNTGVVTIDASQINLQADTTTVQEELNKKVERWGDLEYLIEHKIANIFNKDVIIDSQRHHANGVITTESEWCRYEISCKPNEVISIAKKKHDSQVITFLNSSGNRVMSDNYTSKSVNGWQHYIITVPSNNDIEKVSINIYKPHNPLDGNSVMIYKGDKEPTTEYYPFANGYNVIIDGSKVALTFDPTGSSLASLTTHDAIIELDKKIVNAGGGTVTSVNGVMPNGGDVELTAVISHPNKNILLRVGNQDFATLECMTEQDANDIIDSFTL